MLYINTVRQKNLWDQVFRGHKLDSAFSELVFIKPVIPRGDCSVDPQFSSVKLIALQQCNRRYGGLHGPPHQLGTNGNEGAAEEAGHLLLVYV